MQHRRIIKRGPVVVATQEDGSMDPTSTSSQGLFLADTRHLSRFALRLDDTCPVLMGSTEETLFSTSFIFTNETIGEIPRRSLGLLQRNTIEADGVHIDIAVVNWSLQTVQCTLSLELASDFYDSFEARGVKRMKRGELKAPRASGGSLVLEYIGLDRVTRTTTIHCEPRFQRFEENIVYFPCALTAGERTHLKLHIESAENIPEGEAGQAAPCISQNAKPDWFDDHTHLRTDNATVNAILARSQADLELLLTEFPDAWVLAAGLPRFSVPFGRDSLVASLQTLVFNPHIARETLRFLAHRQGKEDNPWNYEQPGKIMHEMHTGELARLKEVPFGLFYGSVDSTLYFLVLGAEYIRWTGDLDLYRELQPNFDAAWQWVWTYGDIQHKGYVQYQAHTPPAASTAALTVGLFNQGWKDSSTALTYSDGTIVKDHPIALAEVQGDLYRALHTWAEVFDSMHTSEEAGNVANQLFERAHALKVQFNRDFWMEDRQYYAMALDGSGRHVDITTSNPLECLWARLIDDEHADALVAKAMSKDMFSTWGIRTMSSVEKAFNPFSYHNGSVWPFENSLIAAGLKKYGYVEETQDVINALIDASLQFEYRRWPEVYAGVSKDIGGVLARQPDASRPQAWSAGAIFLLMQTILGIATEPFSKRVHVTPVLPAGMNEIEVDNLHIAGAILGLRLQRSATSVLLEITHNPGDLEVVVHPASRNHQRLHGERMPAVSH